MALETWGSDHAYDQYIGRWSRKVASEFLNWLGVPQGLSWVDIGCGTGALTSAILAKCEPSKVYSMDASQVFLLQARRRIRDLRACFAAGDAVHLPLSSAVCEVAVAGLLLNFVGDQESLIREMARMTRPGGWVALYVWDYAGGMQMVRHFWDAAIAVSPKDAGLDQAERFPICQPGPLQALFERVQLHSVQVRPIDILTVFQNFDDYWTPFLGRTGSAPTYLASVSEEQRERIRQVLKSRLVPEQDSLIELTARAWAVQGVV